MQGPGRSGAEDSTPTNLNQSDQQRQLPPFLQSQRSEGTTFSGRALSTRHPADTADLGQRFLQEPQGHIHFSPSQESRPQILPSPRVALAPAISFGAATTPISHSAQSFLLHPRQQSPTQTRTIDPGTHPMTTTTRPPYSFDFLPSPQPTAISSGFSSGPAMSGDSAPSSIGADGDEASWMSTTTGSVTGISSFSRRTSTTAMAALPTTGTLTEHHNAPTLSHMSRPQPLSTHRYTPYASAATRTTSPGSGGTRRSPTGPQGFSAAPSPIATSTVGLSGMSPAFHSAPVGRGFSTSQGHHLPPEPPTESGSSISSLTPPLTVTSTVSPATFPALYPLMEPGPPDRRGSITYPGAIPVGVVPPGAIPIDHLTGQPMESITGQSLEEFQDVMVKEEKRKRNKESSQRFRDRTKEKNRERQERVAFLENRIHELETELARGSGNSIQSTAGEVPDLGSTDRPVIQAPESAEGLKTLVLKLEEENEHLRTALARANTEIQRLSGYSQAPTSRAPLFPVLSMGHASSMSPETVSSDMSPQTAASHQSPAPSRAASLPALNRPALEVQTSNLSEPGVTTRGSTNSGTQRLEGDGATRTSIESKSNPK